MTRDADRVVVPIDGPRPPRSRPPGDDVIELYDEADETMPTAAFTPTQLAVGFGIVAALILLLIRRGRGKP